ncbi:MAG: acyltransferase family protein [Pseudolysinimonas sp.]|uniref:acyltransferase family protein n=1 Tax=Pseudolysinimonas sp. TaxID=2680009 RepID=UPI003262CEBE
MPTSSATPSSQSAATTASSIDLSKRDLTLDLARVFCVLLVVVIHLLFIGVGFSADGQLVISRPLELQPWFAAATWFGQIMPLFFVVGGFASITAWRSSVRRGGTAADYVKARVLRLAQPTLPLFIFYVVVIGAATIIGIDPALLGSVVMGAGSPLWFVAAYVLCQAFVPVMVRFHTRAAVPTLVVLLVGVIVVDAVQFSTAIPVLGYFNMFFVWLLVQQIGFWYADGWFARRRWWQLVLIPIVCYAALVPIVFLGPYDTNMLTNLNPPTLPLVLLALAQACLLRLLRPALAKLMSTRGARAVVFLAGSRLMTIYLWHLPIIIMIAGVALLIPGASPEPASPAWWWSRILVYLIVLAALFALSFLVGRWEQPRELGPTPPIVVVAVAAVLTFVPAFLVTVLFLQLWLAILGAGMFSVAILLLGRWPQRWGGSETVTARDAATTPGRTPRPTAETR